MAKEYYKLTAPQQSIWLTEQYYKNTNINNVCGTFYSTEKLDFELLKKSLNIFLKNNDSFKIKLELTNDEIKQYFSEIDNINFEIVDVKNKEEQTALEQKIASKVFNMVNSLLFEIVLFRYPDNHGGFVINSHHIISDSWTNGLIANTVALIYSKLKNNEEYIFDNNLSYKNYIQSELDYINSSKFEKDKKYWDEVFSTVPEIATIPSVKDTSKNQNDLQANRFMVNIDEKLLDSIKSYCEKNKVSLYNFFMSVFSLYLGRVSNLDEFVIGTPILNRTNFKEKQTTGMFINTLPLKINLSHDKTFLDNLKDITVNSTGLLRHQKYSFQYIIEDLRKKDSSLPKLYNIIFSYQITKMNENMDSLEHTTSWIFDGTIADDLDIHMFEWNENNSIQIAYDYRTNKYDEQDILDLHARILHVINQILENENILLKDIEIVTPEEKHKILYEFNNTKVDYPKDKTIVDLFEEQVEKTPDNIAVVFENQQLTYRELNEKANQLARYLIKEGIKENQVVALFLDKSLELIISILSILKCNCAFLPIDIDYPAERISFILKDSNAKLLLTTSLYSNKFNSNFISILIDKLKLDSFNKDNLLLDSDSSTLAYIMYTSGSTGTPKGVMITNKNIIRLVKNTNYISFNPNDRILQTGSIVFDACTFEIWGALLNGLQLFLLKKCDLLNPTFFANYLEKNKITSLFLTTALFNKFCEENPKMFDTLSYLLTGGEAVSIKHMQIAKKANPNLNLVHVYGPTENTTFSTYFPVKNISDIIPIGYPISNSTCYVMSKQGFLQPIGVPGELWVGGDGVGKGYLNREDLNSQKFIDDPFNKCGKIYKTGDLVRFLPDGSIDFIGRIDNQVKIRGFRIELSEIDSKILTYPGIKQSFSMVNTINDTKYICTYFISSNRIDNIDLKTYLKSILPTYMIPNFLIQLDSLPLNINGKIDKKSLPKPNFTGNNKNIIPPSNNLEKEILGILKTIISNNDISVLDDFFDDLGLDSLNAMKLSALLSKYNISIQDINTYSSIRNLSNHISNTSNFEDKEYKLPTASIINKTFSFDLSNVLLTGGIGFLGMHILYELINNPSVSKVYCLIRRKDNLTPYERLENILDFYFSSEVKAIILKSVVILEGDFSYENLKLNELDYHHLLKNITTVIHCGANVKHYGKFEQFYKSNVIGTKNVLQFCKDSNAKLAHISTTSVGGFSKISDLKTLDEDSIYIGQHFNNHVYMITKYLAEIEVLNSIKNNMVNAKIFRIGNMMPRLSDNKFQVNLYDNAFISRLETLSKLKCITHEYKNVMFDITPVDLCCNAIMRILNESPNSQTIYHIYNPETFTVESIFSILHLNVKEVSNITLINKIINSDNPLFSHLLNDLKNKDSIESNVINNKTTEFLNSIQFHWPKLPNSYIEHLINLY